MINRFSPKFLAVLLCLGILLPGGLHNTDYAFAADKKKGKKESEEESKPEENKSQASYRCEADVFYVWKRVPRPQMTTDSSGKQVAMESTLDESLLEPIDVFYSRPGATADSEAAAGQRLDTQLPAAQSQARTACERMHQSESRCVMSKLRLNGREYNLLDFRARQQFLDSVAEDCRRNVGVCLSTKVGKTRCEMQQTASAEQTAGDSEDDEKDSKKKKK